MSREVVPLCRKRQERKRTRLRLREMSAFGAASLIYFGACLRFCVEARF